MWRLPWILESSNKEGKELARNGWLDGSTRFIELLRSCNSTFPKKSTKYFDQNKALLNLFIVCKWYCKVAMSHRMYSNKFFSSNFRCCSFLIDSHCLDSLNFVFSSNYCINKNFLKIHCCQRQLDWESSVASTWKDPNF